MHLGSGYMRSVCYIDITFTLYSPPSPPTPRNAVHFHLHFVPLILLLTEPFLTASSSVSCVRLVDVALARATSASWLNFRPVTCGFVQDIDNTPDEKCIYLGSSLNKFSRYLVIQRLKLHITAPLQHKFNASPQKQQQQTKNQNKKKNKTNFLHDQLYMIHIFNQRTTWKQQAHTCFSNVQKVIQWRRYTGFL